MKIMFKITLLTIFLITICGSIFVDVMTKERLEAIKQGQDFKHHFIFFHQPTLDAIRDQLEAWEEKDINLYINDCKKNNLPECENTKQTPVILLFNRILIRFNGDPNVPEQIIEWGERRIDRSPKFINTREELDSFIAQSPNSFCFCQAPNELQGTGLFYTLSKTLPFLDYCIINNIEVYTNIGLKTNNITMFLDSATNRRQFEHQNRFEAWEWFSKTNMFPTIQRVSSIVAERFAQKQKILNFYALACDFSLKCDQALEELKYIQKQLSVEDLGLDFKLSIQDQKESFTFNLYYHLSFDHRKLPALVHIDLKSPEGNAGNLIREIQYIERFDRKALDSFITRTEKGEVKPFFLSSAIPKNNGFYGKASQKLIQKLVASNAQSVIANSNNHYVLLFTALNIGCEACETFYKEYKQIASLLVEKDVTFGILNVNLNEVSFKHITQLPDLLLFKKDDKGNPIRMNVNHSFDHLMLFFKNNLGNQYADPNEL